MKRAMILFSVLISLLFLVNTSYAIWGSHPEIESMHIERDLVGHSVRGWKFAEGEPRLIEILDAKYDKDTAVVYIFIKTTDTKFTKGKEGKLRLQYEYAAADWNLLNIKPIAFENLSHAKIRNIKLSTLYPVIMATLDGELSKVEALIEKGEDANEKTEFGSTALMFAAAGGHVDIVKILLSKGAHVNAINENYETALMVAADGGYIDIVKILLSKGAHVNEINEKYETALTVAENKGHTDIVRVLKNAGAKRPPIKVGGIFDLTGPSSAVGKDYGQACKDAERYINGHGGVNGRSILLMSNDYAYKIPKAVQIYKRLKEVDKIFAIQGWGTGDTKALKQQVNRDHIVYFSADYDPLLGDPSRTPYNFYVGTSYSDAIRLAMKFIKDTFTEIFPNEGDRAPRVVFIYPDHPFGKNPIPAGKTMARELGIKVGPDEIVPLRAVDATQQLLHMKKFDPDWAWVGGTSPSTSVIAKDAAKLGLRTKFISNMWGFDENLLKLAGNAGNERVYGVAPFAFWGEDVPGMKVAVAAAKSTDSKGYHTVRYIQGWSAMMVMWEGLKRAASANELNGPGLKKALESLRDFDTDGLTPPITFTSSDHRPNTSLRIFKISNDKLIWVKNVDIPREDRFLGW